MFRNILPALVLGLSALLSAASVHAEDQKAEQLHIRGSIVSYSGPALKVKTHEGETVDVTLADGWKLASVANAAVTDIKPGDFVGIASLRVKAAATARLRC